MQKIALDQTRKTAKLGTGQQQEDYPSIAWLISVI